MFSSGRSAFSTKGGRPHGVTQLPENETFRIERRRNMPLVCAHKHPDPYPTNFTRIQMVVEAYPASR